jgi:hypothetical protein
MSLLPDSASFHEKVQDAFVAYRGSGVSLSAADLELLDAWASKEVPFEVVARGLRKAAEAALWDSADGEGKLRSLKGCRKAVEAEIGKYLRQTAGRTAQEEGVDEPFHVTRHKKLVATLKKVTKPNVPGWVERLGVPEDFAQGDRQEHLAIALLCRALPFERRHALLREARASVEKAFAMTAATKRESFKFHRSALVRQAWSMPALW